MHILGGLPQSAHTVFPFAIPLIDLPHPPHNLWGRVFGFPRLVLRWLAWHVAHRVASGWVVWVMSSAQPEQALSFLASRISWVTFSVRARFRHVDEQNTGRGPVLLGWVNLPPHWMQDRMTRRITGPAGEPRKYAVSDPLPD